MLERGFVRRKRWEAELLANYIAAALGRSGIPRESTGDPDDWPVGGAVVGASGTRYRVVSADALCTLLGG